MEAGGFGHAATAPVRRTLPVSGARTGDLAGTTHHVGDDTVRRRSRGKPARDARPPFSLPSSRRTGCPNHVSSGAAVGGAGGRAQMANGYLNFLQFRSFPREVSGLYVFCTLKRAELRI